jgi:hypothetical protein
MLRGVKGVLMVPSKPRMYATKKYVYATSAAEAIALDKETAVHEAYLCSDPSKEDEDKNGDVKAVGFASIPDPFAEQEDDSTCGACGYFHNPTAPCVRRQ